MAVDEFLLENAISRGECAVRIYRWDKPTLSLGYFQKPNEVPCDLQKDNLPLVRRLSGGGAILHHHELTYSLAIPSTHPFAANPVQLYDLVHNAIILLLKHQNIEARLFGSTSVSAAINRQNEPFLCFLRRASSDVIVGEAKILGSAQRRRKGAVLQHGSLILKSSPHAAEVPGLCELSQGQLSTSHAPDFNQQELASTIGAIISENRQPSQLTQNEQEVIATKLLSQYENPQLSRSPVTTNS